MTEAATAETMSLLVDESSGRDEFERVRRLAYSDKSESDALKESVEQLAADHKAARVPEKKASLALQLGVARWVLGDCDEALEVLEEVKNTRNGSYVYGRCLYERGRFAEAAKAFSLAAARGDDAFDMAMWVADARRNAGDLDAALEQVRAYQESHADRAELHYQKGRCVGDMGEHESAMEDMERALELDPEHAGAAFRLAFLCELRGLDEMALEYYEKCVAVLPTYAHALLNLGQLCEDLGDHPRAHECYQRVVNANPQNGRARLFLRDVEGSMHMYYDEESLKRSDRTQSLLSTPVSDFELSVRSRNCLAKMNVRCLGDLVRLTEQDLLAFKNFGETSLNEIKEMLRVKGLRFGMTFAEDQQATADVLAVPSPEQQDVLSRGIEDLDLSIRSRRAVEALGVGSIGDLCRLTDTDLLQCKNFGQTSLNELRRKLGERSLSLRQSSA